MTNRLILLLLSLFFCGSGFAQSTLTPSDDPQPRLPSPEEFVNQVFHIVVDSSAPAYYLITGADTCRFAKYDYEEWAKYYLKEFLPFVTMNELSEKAYLSRYPYYWKQDHLEKALCITVPKADTVLFPERYTPASTHSPKNPSPRAKKSKTKPVHPWVFSFSLPQFTDDGHYAVIDLNSICGANCGTSLTCIFKHTSSGWMLIGRHTNYSSLPTSN